MAEVELREGSNRANFPVFTEGYYARRVANGERPKHGYPTNHLPEAAIKEIVTESGYVASLKKGK